MRVVLALAAIVLLHAGTEVPSVWAQQDTLYYLNADSLRGSVAWTRLPTVLKYTPEDDPSFAEPSFDDSAWKPAHTRMLPEPPLPDGWNGVGWFRLRFRVDSVLVHRPVGLHLEQRGASEVYLNGRRLYASGEVGATADETRSTMQTLYYVFTFDEREEHVLAIRYAMHNPEPYHHIGFLAGFHINFVANINTQFWINQRAARTTTIVQFFLIGVFATFTLLHLILFAFYPQATENLYFALFIGAYIGLVYLFHQAQFVTDPIYWVYQGRLQNTLGIVLGLAGLRFVYQLFYERIPRHYYVIAILGLAAIASSWLLLTPSFDEGIIFVSITCVELLRMVGVALFKRKPGARVVGLGITILALSIGYYFLINYGVVPWSTLTPNTLPSLGMLALTVTMSIYLSRNIARTNQRLRQQLQRVQELSQLKLQQERQLREEAISRSLLEAEYQQKLHELEEARELQLSMLPDQVPEHPLLDLAAYMETATEVGGDYYDFRTAADGTLTVAVGDATGHGMKAGTMVTATKSLFNVLGEETTLLSFFDRSTRALKAMNLRRLYMALTLAKFERGRLRLATAGMPPTLIFRAATGEVDVVRLKGMPLGSFVDFPYREEEVLLAEGDTVLFMSDGFPELFNTEGEMMGYDRAVEVFAQAAHQPAQGIIDHLVAEGRTWSNNRAPDDDMTFVVLKVRTNGQTQTGDADA